MQRGVLTFNFTCGVYKRVAFTVMTNITTK